MRQQWLWSPWTESQGQLGRGCLGLSGRVYAALSSREEAPRRSRHKEKNVANNTCFFLSRFGLPGTLLSLFSATYDVWKLVKETIP